MSMRTALAPLKAMKASMDARAAFEPWAMAVEATEGGAGDVGVAVAGVVAVFDVDDDVLAVDVPNETAPGRGDTPSGLDWGGFELGGALCSDPVHLGQGRARLAGLEVRPRGRRIRWSCR